MTPPFPVPISLPEIDGHHVRQRFRREDVDLVQAYFSTRRAGVKEEPRSLVTILPDGRDAIEVVGCRGLNPVFRALTGTSDTDAEDRRLAWREDHDPRLLERGPENVLDEGLRFVREKAMGVLRTPSTRRLMELITQCVTAYPSRRLMVLCASKGAGIALGQSVQLQVPTVLRRHFAVLESGCAGLRHARYYFGGVQDLHWIEDRLHSIDLMLLRDARFAIHEDVPDFAAEFSRAKIIGVLGCKEVLTPYEDDCIRSVLGFEETTIVEPRRAARTVSVRRLRVKGGESLPASVRRGDLLDRGIVHHRARNRVLCDQATALAGTPHLIIAADWRHAMSLAARLGDWHLVPFGERQSEERTRLYARLPRRPRPMLIPRQDIVSLDDVSRVDLSLYDVVIYGAGTTDVSPHLREQTIPGYWTREQLIWIDLADRHHPLLRHDASRRYRTYLTWGWETRGLTASAERLAAFLERRAANAVSVLTTP